MRDTIQIVSTAGTGYAYVTTKNKRTMAGKLELKNMSNGETIELDERVFVEADEDLMAIFTES